MNYYSIFTDKTDLHGVPAYLEARLYEQPPAGDAFDSKNAQYYEWMKPGFNDTSFPDPLYLFTKNSVFSFDYYFLTSHFILSADFLTVTDQYTRAYTKSRLHIEPAVAGAKLNVEKDYYFVKFDYAADVIDYDASVCEFAKDDKGNPLIHNGVRYVRSYEQIVLNGGFSEDLFLIKDPVLGRNLFCSQRFKESAEKANLYGLRFVPLAETADMLRRK